MKDRKGFTALELLIVIAILAVLAAIVFPVTVKARDAAKRTACRHSLRNIGLALVLYSQDWDHFVPPEGITDSLAGDQINSNKIIGNAVEWRNDLLPYAGSKEVFWCPSWPFERRDNLNFQSHLGPINGGTSYTYFAGIKADNFGTPEGVMRLSLDILPDKWEKAFGGVSAAPLLVDASWDADVETTHPQELCAHGFAETAEILYWDMHTGKTQLTTKPE